MKGWIQRAAVWICLAVVGATPALAAELAQKKVLVVHSYHKAQKGHVVEMTQGIQEAFSGAGITMAYLHMDTKRRPDEAWKKKAGQMALDTMNTFGPDVVIAMDDIAQAYFVQKAMDLPNAPVFIFGGVNADPARYGYPRDNVTGVLERPNIKESLDLLLKISPGVKTLLMICDDSMTSDLFVSYCQGLDLPVTVVGYARPANLKEWEAVIEANKGQVDAFGLYLLRTIKDRGGGMVPETDLMAILNQRSALPTVGFFDTAAEAGVLCGISVSMKEQGYEAGRIARAVLEGASPKSFPMAPTRRGRIQLNLVQAERLGIDLDWQIISKADVVVR